jgi:hypothetical protein
MAPDLERLARTPWPVASLASSGISNFSSAFARSCSRKACRVLRKIPANSAQEFEALMSTIRTPSMRGLGGSTPNSRGGSPFSTQHQNFRSAVTMFIDEANWLQEHPAAPELRLVSEFNEMFIQNGSPCSYVWNLVALLPEDYRAAIRKKFKCPSTDYDDEWIDQVKKFITDMHTVAALGALSNREEPHSVGQTAAKIRELSAKQTALEDRLDIMIDKALKRLATLKTFKQIVAIQETGQPRKISAS